MYMRIYIVYQGVMRSDVEIIPANYDIHTNIFNVYYMHFQNDKKMEAN